MSIYALIKNGLVENTVLWDGDGDIFEGYETINIDGLDVGIGWTFDGSKFTSPAEPEPTHDELVYQAEVKKQALIDQANEYINSKQWPGKAAMGRLSETDKAQYGAWLDHLDAIDAVDPSDAPNISWHEAPN